VTSVSRSAVSPSEMTQQLTGLTALYGANEPVYRITVELKQQTVVAYGNPMPLQPGMKLEADVLLESRRLVEWMLEPLFSISGKWTG
jgi:membrane fusion protein